MNHLRDLDVLVLGLGESGLAMARWCGRHGARVQVWDSRAEPPQAAALRADVPAATLRSGPLGADDLAGVHLVLKSPGLAPHDERIAPLLAAARATGVAVQGELDLFARALADLKAGRGYAPRVLAITGTNGKTTTTSMCALLVGATGRRVATAGNIGPTMLDTLAAALDREPAPAADEPAAVEATQGPDAERPAATSPAEAADAASPEATASQAAVSQAAVSQSAVSQSDLSAGEDATSETTAQAAEPPEPTDGADTHAAPLDDDAPPQLAPPPPAAPVFEHLPEFWVLELSSFQLDGGGGGVHGFEPTAGVVLNLTQDHLDWHGDMAAYAAAKAHVYGPVAPPDATQLASTVMVVNADDPLVQAMVPPPRLVKQGKGRPAKALTRRVLRFGLQPPQHPGDFGLVVENGMAWLVRAMEADETVKRGRRGAQDEPEEIHLQRLMPADALRVRGRHNAANALAALALATSAGCALAPMLHALRDYAGEPHRVQYLGLVQGVEAYDDSKGTNVGATVAALEGLGADKAPAKLVVILGGDGKGQDFAPLAGPVARHARAVALIGRDADAIRAALGEPGLPIERLDDLPSAVRWCFERAHAGDAVLLSPACASLDMFRHYAHRAEVFVDAVRALADEHGEMLA